MAVILKEFNDNPHIVNIELGAGCGNFGQKYHPECFLTEKRTITEVKKACSEFFVTVFSCDAHNIPCEENRFNHVILCNPNGYGFRDSEDGLLLLSELARILKNKGNVTILGTLNNSYTNRIEKRIIEFNAQNLFIQFDCSIHEIDHQKDYPDHSFFYTDGVKSIFPKHKTSLICHK
jgi:ubiquinone/menaquinone biosynthesis C-methylase UbiE